MSGAPIEKVGIIANPWSGRGAGARIAESLAQFLTGRGLAVETRESAPSYVTDDIDPFFQKHEAVLVIGGDGTVGKLLPVAARTVRPIYMLPAGNESLFARAFGMSGTFDNIQRTLQRGAISQRYFAYAGQTPFFLMASVGFDALVVEALSRVRRGPVGTKGYVLPSCKVFMKYRAPEIVVTIDGKQVLEGERGFFIVANSPEYARRLDPVRGASSEEPLLQARFFRNFSRSAVVRSVIAAAMKQPLTLPSERYSGRVFEISSTIESPVQADGDFVGSTPIRVARAEELVPILLPYTSSSDF